LPQHPEQLVIDALAERKLDQPISTPSEMFTQLNYHLISYYKAAYWMQQLESIMSRAVFDSAMKIYYRDWQFRHPDPLDFKSTMEKVSGKLFDNQFALLNESGSAPEQLSNRKVKPTFLFSVKNYERNMYINFIPVIGYNVYDKVMPGIAIHNFNVAMNKLQFFAIPLYSTGTGKLNGSAGIYYTSITDSRKWIFGTMLSRFASLSGIDSNGRKVYGGFHKIVPSLKFKFSKDLRSTIDKSIEWKLFLIGERGFDYVIKNSDSSYYPSYGQLTNRYLNQLTFTISNLRVLYPYNMQWQLQQGQGFYRFNATGNYFFNYANRGGMQVRLFAAKFGYLGSVTSLKQFETSIYHPKLSAVRGNEDYTYSNYFIGRNERDGLSGQQIMMRDGGLKLRTDLFQGLQGRSDNWIAAINLNTTLPKKLLPFKFPLRLFMDVGTYAETWKNEAATPKLLFVGGLQLSIFKDLLNIYAPIVYSRDFRESLKSVPEENTFFRKISFSIDIHQFSLRKLIAGKLPFQ